LFQHDTWLILYNNVLIFFLDNVTIKVEIEPKNIMMDTLFNNTLVLILSALGFVIVAGALLSILLSQRLHKRHRGYNPTDNQVLFIKLKFNYKI